jgi:hypothetical protein
MLPGRDDRGNLTNVHVRLFGIDNEYVLIKMGESDLESGIVVQSCNPSISEAESGRS